MANKWSFDNKKGKDSNSSEKWGQNYKNCMIENTQSPINIVSGGNKKCGPLSCPIKFNYSPSRCTLKKDKNLLYLIDKGNSHINYKLNTFTLKKTSFHMPSMHTLDGAYYDMELMLHHIADNGEKVIVSVFVSKDNDISGSNNWFRQFVPYLKKYKKEDIFKKVSIITKDDWNINNLLPIGRSFYMYMGSLPYPPCEMSTIFIVLNNAVNINTEDYNILKQIINNTNRPIQKIGNRTVYFNDKLNNDIKKNKIYIKCAKIEKKVTKEGMTSPINNESKVKEISIPDKEINVVLTSKINYWNIFTLLIGLVFISLSAYGGMELVRWLIKNNYISFCNAPGGDCPPIVSESPIDNAKGGGKLISNFLDIMQNSSKKKYNYSVRKDIENINSIITKYRGNINYK
jgi:carbonic anhydrase